MLVGFPFMLLTLGADAGSEDSQHAKRGHIACLVSNDAALVTAL
jgi:hypothetical protein